MPTEHAAVQITFPAIYFHADGAMGIADDADDLEISTRLALKSKAHRGLRIIDDSGRELLVRDAVKTGHVGRFGGWNIFLTQWIRVRLICEEVAGHRSVDQVRSMVLAYFSRWHGWSSAGNYQDVRRAVERAASIGEIVNALRDPSSRIARYILVGSVTILLWLLWYFLMAMRLEPIVLGPPPDLIAKESYPYLSLRGCVLWILLLALYSYVVSRIVVRTLGFSTTRVSAVISIGLFLVSCIFIAVIHPFFMLAILLPHYGPQVAIFIESHLPLLNHLYFHWGFQERLPSWPFVHLALVGIYLFATCGILRLRRNSKRTL